MSAWMVFSYTGSYIGWSHLICYRVHLVTVKSGTCTDNFPWFTRGKRQTGNKMLTQRFHSKMFPISILTPSMGRSHFMCHHYGSDKNILYASTVFIVMTILIMVNQVNWSLIQDHMSADKDLIVMPYQMTHTLVLNHDRNWRKAIMTLFAYESTLSSSHICM